MWNRLGRLLKDDLTAPYWDELMAFVRKSVAHSGSVYPPANQVFRALELTWCQHEGVIIGQDPYHDPGQANGLNFSVPRGVRRPQSPVRIHAELRTDFDVRIPNQGSSHRGQRGAPPEQSSHGFAQGRLFPSREGDGNA